MVVTREVLSYLGNRGAYILGCVLGFTDVDPFIMSLTQSVGVTIQPVVGAGAVVLAAASNNLAKGIYAYFFSKSRTGRQSFLLLVLLALAGLLPLFWL